MCNMMFTDSLANDFVLYNPRYYFTNYDEWWRGSTGEGKEHLRKSIFSVHNTGPAESYWYNQR